MLTGSLIAIVTPFKNGKLDERALGDLIEWQIASGTHGIVPCGTTGESATLTHAEHDRVVAFTVEVVRRRVPVVAGTGSNNGRSDCPDEARKSSRQQIDFRHAALTFGLAHARADGDDAFRTA